MNPSTASGFPRYATLLSTSLTFPLTGESFFHKGGIKGIVFSYKPVI